jgi:hypothetical protein
MTRPADLAALQMIVQARHALVQSRMADIQRREGDIRETMAALGQDRSARAADIVEAKDEDAALQAGQDLRWHHWIDGRKARLNGDLATLAQHKEWLRAELARQTGRKDVVETLVKQDRAARARRKAADPG